MKRILTALVVVAFTAAVPTIGAAKTAKTQCNSTITGTVDGGITVSAGDNCVLNGATVNGGVRMSGGTLEVCDSTINGGVRSTGGNCVTVGLGSDDLPNTCSGDTINGGVRVENVDNDTATPCPGVADVELEDSNINGGVDLEDNDAVQVEGNTIHGVLDCQGNTSATGSPNTVTGQKKGQCAGL